MKKKVEKIVFKCRKCGATLTIRIKPEDPLRDVLRRIEAVSTMDCRGCGEEPYDNWLLAYVELDEASE